MRILVGLIAFTLAPTAAQAEEKPVDDEKMVCRSERSVGSNRSIRVCKTRAASVRSNADEAQRKANHTGRDECAKSTCASTGARLPFCCNVTGAGTDAP